ncbi:MAG TPA: hypothetical protein ENO20_07965 [Bacteroides sp.]|nr:hypothetical protein [Bacteroides sp.]
MKNFIYLLALLFVSSSVFARKADFSGRWKINREKSEMNDQFSMAPDALVMKQDKKTLSIERHSSFQGESFSFTDNFTLDGKECENRGWMDSVKKSTAVWDKGKKSLTITSKIPMQDGGDMTITEILSMDGDNLVVESTASSSFGEMTEKFVFDKE